MLKIHSCCVALTVAFCLSSVSMATFNDEGISEFPPPPGCPDYHDVVPGIVHTHYHAINRHIGLQASGFDYIDLGCKITQADQNIWDEYDQIVYGERLGIVPAFGPGTQTFRSYAFIQVKKLSCTNIYEVPGQPAEYKKIHYHEVDVPGDEPLPIGLPPGQSGHIIHLSSQSKGVIEGWLRFCYPFDCPCPEVNSFYRSVIEADVVARGISDPRRATSFAIPFIHDSQSGLASSLAKIEFYGIASTQAVATVNASFPGAQGSITVGAGIPSIDILTDSLRMVQDIDVVPLRVTDKMGCADGKVQSASVVTNTEAVSINGIRYIDAQAQVNVTQNSVSGEWHVIDCEPLAGISQAVIDVIFDLELSPCEAAEIISNLTPVPTHREFDYYAQKLLDDEEKQLFLGCIDRERFGFMISASLTPNPTD